VFCRGSCVDRLWNCEGIISVSFGAVDVKLHYDQHLASFYSWMVGDFAAKAEEQTEFFRTLGILPADHGRAVDLGSGHGIQTLALANLGFSVLAVDFNRSLLDELNMNCAGKSVRVHEGDIRNSDILRQERPELIVCWGDTLCHLSDEHEVEQFISESAGVLPSEGRLVLSFRDYTHELKGDLRFIPVRSDDSRILTCFLEYEISHVTVTDLLQEKVDGQWVQKVSSYRKARLGPARVKAWLEKSGCAIVRDEVWNRQVVLVGEKK